MKTAFVATWSTLVPGREKKGTEFYREMTDFFAKLATEGKVTEPEFLFGPAGLRIFFVKGDYEALVGLLSLPKFQEFIFTSSFVAEDFQYVITPLGTEEFIHGYEQVGAKLGFI